MSISKIAKDAAKNMSKNKDLMDRLNAGGKIIDENRDEYYNKVIKPGQKDAKNPFIGAALGAAIGAVAGKRTKPSSLMKEYGTVGAVTGLLGGGAVNSYRQTQRLKDFYEGHGMTANMIGFPKYKE